MTEKTVTIMGEVWQIKEGTEEEFPGLVGVDGYTDSSIRTIVVDSTITISTDPMDKENLTEYWKTVLRHEVIHAFLYESGLDGNSADCENWAQNEEMVDWIALQFPKIHKVFVRLSLL